MRSLDKLDFEEITKLFKNRMGRNSINVITKTEVTMDLDSQMYKQYGYNIDQGKKFRFMLEHENEIDKRKYVTMQLKTYMEMLNNWEQIKNDVDCTKSEAILETKKIISILKKEPNTPIFMFDQSNQTEVLEISSYGLIDEFEGRRRERKSDGRLEKMAQSGLLAKLANVIYLSDLSDCVTTPRELGEYIIVASVKKAMIKTGIIDKKEANKMLVSELMNRSRQLDRNPEYRLNLRDELCYQIVKFKDRINCDNLLMCGSYRCREYINLASKIKEKSSYEIGELEMAYNIMVDISEEVGNKNLKLKARIYNKEKENKTRISYTTRDMKYDLKRLRSYVNSSNYIMKMEESEGLLKGKKETSINIPQVERVDKPNDILPTKGEIDPRDPKVWRAKQMANFVSPEEKIEIFGLNHNSIWSKGIAGKAFEGYGVVEYTDLGIGIIECIWEKDKDNKKRFPYGNATVIARKKLLDEILNSETKLEKIPTMKSLRVRDDDDMRFSGRKDELETAAEEGMKTHEVNIIRLYHGKKWRDIMTGIVTGRIDPFKMNISTRAVKRNKQQQEKEKPEQETTVKGPSLDE